MDCTSEEHLIRIKLQELSGIQRLEFDLPSRSLAIFHSQPLSGLGDALASIHMEGTLVSSGSVAEIAEGIETDTSERKPLIAALVINAALFLGESVAGILSHSMGLLADSLDMLADGIVYALSLWAVGQALTRKKSIAKASGFLQVGLAVLGLSEVVRRFFTGEQLPDFRSMVVVSCFALIANVATLFILSRARNKEAHMRASVVFTSNDVLVNLFVMGSGAMVHFSASRMPDLLAGAIIFLVVANGARTILALSK